MASSSLRLVQKFTVTTSDEIRDSNGKDIGPAQASPSIKQERCNSSEEMDFSIIPPGVTSKSEDIDTHITPSRVAIESEEMDFIVFQPSLTTKEEDRHDSEEADRTSSQLLSTDLSSGDSEFRSSVTELDPGLPIPAFLETDGSDSVPFYLMAAIVQELKELRKHSKEHPEVISELVFQEFRRTKRYPQFNHEKSDPRLACAVHRLIRIHRTILMDSLKFSSDQFEYWVQEVIFVLQSCSEDPLAPVKKATLFKWPDVPRNDETRAILAQRPPRPIRNMVRTSDFLNRLRWEGEQRRALGAWSPQMDMGSLPDVKSEDEILGNSSPPIKYESMSLSDKIDSWRSREKEESDKGDSIKDESSTGMRSSVKSEPIKDEARTETDVFVDAGYEAYLYATADDYKGKGRAVD
ncbi:hypothetical protein EJ05DRAFT_519264 [Pseudovirgaria hyperparasitica]|uniref:Uncharacterized protein n=1 Tax=Pseudovirgaria hyperparasitica TaxID=470096 RepID=A0A6A6VY47_9PEZI|nr:uncharacterized protein EJ05DRAFT_519264 [Pseudovirgaria hyperparasitica]KAF2755542.1 hypothetical protein EJ05DRAFT_519264 [Pseudovirgaria hyperparasitica]